MEQMILDLGYEVAELEQELELVNQGMSLVEKASDLVEDRMVSAGMNPALIMLRLTQCYPGDETGQLAKFKELAGSSILWKEEQ